MKREKRERNLNLIRAHAITYANCNLLSAITILYNCSSKVKKYLLGMFVYFTDIFYIFTFTYVSFKRFPENYFV